MRSLEEHAQDRKCHYIIQANYYCILNDYTVKTFFKKLTTKRHIISVLPTHY